MGIGEGVTFIQMQCVKPLATKFSTTEHHFENMQNFLLDFIGGNSHLQLIYIHTYILTVIYLIHQRNCLTPWAPDFCKKKFFFYKNRDYGHTVTDKNIWFEMLHRNFSYLAAPRSIYGYMKNPGRGSAVRHDSRRCHSQNFSYVHTNF